jgi:hypothetical protein
VPEPTSPHGKEPKLKKKKNDDPASTKDKLKIKTAVIYPK